ncbi:hypothetical protein [Catellatospora sp. NPDC049609]|uniref:hypothetical protein n=1 Tax=Catellatospora sp. NPDC049609 TaxID=3155505 RepID=UPI0034498864
MTEESRSQLPEWMRKDAPAHRTTLHWKITQWLDRRFWWGGVRRWLRERPRFSKRFPKTYALIAWLVALAIAGWIGYKIIEYYNLIIVGAV